MAVNKWFPGGILFICSACGKEIWLRKDILDRAYGGGKETCLDCRAGKTPLTSNSLKK